MPKKKMDAVVKKPSECTPVELAAFQKLVEEGEEVTPHGLRQRIEQAAVLVFIAESECLAVGAIKKQSKATKKECSQKQAWQKKAIDLITSLAGYT